MLEDSNLRRGYKRQLISEVEKISQDKKKPSINQFNGGFNFVKTVKPNKTVQTGRTITFKELTKGMLLS
jgi:hypothetical protein